MLFDISNAVKLYTILWCRKPFLKMHPTTVLLSTANPYWWETAHFLIVPSVFKGANFSLLLLFVLCRTFCRSQWPRDLRRRSAAARLLGLWVRIPPGAWMCVSYECCVLSGRGLCLSDHSSRGVLPSVVRLNVCGPESSITRRPWPTRTVAPW